MCPTLWSFALSELMRLEQNPSHWYHTYFEGTRIRATPYKDNSTGQGQVNVHITKAKALKERKIHFVI